MPNDDLERVIKDNGLAIPQNDKLNAIVQNHGTVVNNIVLAGLTVRHKLLPYRYLLEGFIVEDHWFNISDFKVNGSIIKYKHPGDSSYISRNEIVYSKLLVDGKKELFSMYFETDDKILFRNDNNLDGNKASFRNDFNRFFWGNGMTNLWPYGTKFEYYLYNNTTSTIPECAANKVFALCKYFEEGEWKYAIFNLHEIIPD